MQEHDYIAIINRSSFCLQGLLLRVLQVSFVKLPQCTNLLIICINMINAVPGSIPTWGLSVWSLHVLPVYAWVLSGYSGFLPPSKNMHVRLIGVSEIVLRSV